MPDAFTKPAPAAFDLDAWIDGARLPEKSVTVYGRADLVAEYETLNARLTSTSDDEQDERLTGSPRQAIAAQMTAVRERMIGSALTFRLRALTAEEVRAIRAAAPTGKDGDPDSTFVAAHWISAACVSPAGLTPEKATVVRERIGEGQFAALWDAAWSATNDKQVPVPFSLAHSATLSTQDS